MKLSPLGSPGSGLGLRAAGAQEPRAVHHPPARVAAAVLASRCVTSLRVLALTLLVACGFTGSNAVHAQAAVNYYGSSCGLPSPWGTPLMRVGGLPRLGMGVGFMALGMSVHRFDNRQPPCEFRGVGYLFLGASNQSWRGFPLPFLLPFELTANYPCGVWAGPDALAGSTLGGLPPIAFLSIPNDPSLLGSRVYAQWWIQSFLQGCDPYRWNAWVTSDAAELVIGL